MIVTGGSSGIGLSTAKQLINEGARSVAIIARTKSILDTAEKELKALAIKTNASVSHINLSPLAWPECIAVTYVFALLLLFSKHVPIC